MPDKLQSLSEKIIQIRSNSAEGDKSIPVKYLSEIITARVEEIMMAVLYEIENSGFADMLRSGIVITGGVAQSANICNFINDISGYKVRTGYPKHLFSHQGCEGLTDTSAATSIGLLLAAKNAANINCIIPKDDPDEDGEEVTVETPEPEDDIERDLWGNVIEKPEVQETPKPEKKTPKQDGERRSQKEPKWKKVKEWADELFKSMEDTNV